MADDANSVHRRDQDDRIDETLASAESDVMDAIEMLEMLPDEPLDPDFARRTASLTDGLSPEERRDYWSIFAQIYPPPEEGRDDDLVAAWLGLQARLKELGDKLVDELPVEQQRAITREVPELIARRRALDSQSYDRWFSRLAPDEQRRIKELEELTADNLG